ncbi:MAG: hypothetical protein SP4CHLAM5_12140 [Chlamydiia bacterium]|nr:hypothetical protein [Chlamydiia bacterium]
MGGNFSIMANRIGAKLIALNLFLDKQREFLRVLDFRDIFFSINKVSTF